MNPLTIALGIGLLVCLSCGLAIAGLLRWASNETPSQRVERLLASQNPLDQAELELPFLDRVIKPWFRRQVQAAGRLAPSYNMERLQQNLVRAGYPYSLTVLDFLGVKLLASLMTAVATLYPIALRRVPSVSAILLPGLAAVLAFLLPDFWLGSRRRERQRQLQRSLPDALDMLTICVDAGAGLDSGMLKISERWQNAMASEFGKVVAEIRIGMSRREALQNLVWRTDVPEVGSFVAVLLQAEQFGLSIASVLHTQSEQMRIRRWQRAEEEARKVPIKLLFPLIFMIFPALLAVTIGPAIPILAHTFAQMTR
jgi:tight adherence protein C